MRRRTRTGALLALLIGAAALALPGAATAVIVHLPGGAAVSYQPVHRALGPAPLTRPQLSKKPLKYHGGAVMTSNTNYPLYWDPAGAPAYPAGYESGVNKWFGDLAHDSGGLQNTDSVLVQYGTEGGEVPNYDSHFGGALLDSDPYPANGCSAAPICLTDGQIQAELQKFIEANGLPMDVAHAYFVLTPPGVESCFEANGLECSANAQNAEYCAYHSFFKVGKTARIVYADDPYVNGTTCEDGNQPNGPSDGAISGGVAHEHSEAVTDPELNAWYDASGEEVADKCATNSEASEYGEPLGKAPDGAKYNQLIDGDFYWYQQEWSNEAGGCQQRAASGGPTVKKLKPKSGPKAGGTKVTIEGKGFIAPVSVYFGEVQATEVVLSNSKALTATSPPGSPGAVFVTVRTAGGTSAASKKTSFKYKPKP